MTHHCDYNIGTVGDGVEGECTGDDTVMNGGGEVEVMSRFRVGVKGSQRRVMVQDALRGARDDLDAKVLTEKRRRRWQESVVGVCRGRRRRGR
jgi:hypothetical protein